MKKKNKKKMLVRTINLKTNKKKIILAMMLNYIAKLLITLILR